MAFVLVAAQVRMSEGYSGSLGSARGHRGGGGRSSFIVRPLGVLRPLQARVRGRGARKRFLSWIAPRGIRRRRYRHAILRTMQSEGPTKAAAAVTMRGLGVSRVL
jgi:hypothetical protein